MTDTRNTTLVAVALVAMILYAVPRQDPTLPASPIFVESLTISDTWDLKNESGLSILGTGGQIIEYGKAVKPNSNFPERATKIIWNGPPDKPIMRLRGIGVHIEGINFIAMTPAAAMIQIEDGDGLASGKHRIERCSFIENPDNGKLTPAISFGTYEKQGNCDATVVDKCIAVNCASLIRQNNSQAVGNRATNCLTINCATAFDFQYGGKFYADGHCSVRDACVLRIKQAGASVNAFELVALSVDKQRPAGFVLIDNQIAKRSFVRITGKISGDELSRAEAVCNDRPEFDLTGLDGIK